MVIKQGSHVFVMTYVGERCAVVGELVGMMYPDATKNASPMVKTGEFDATPMNDIPVPRGVPGGQRRFVKLKNVIWTNGKKLNEKNNWRDGIEGRWLLALEIDAVSDEEWLGYSL